MPDGLTFEWDNPNALLAQIRSLVRDRGDQIRKVPDSAIRRGTFELLRRIQAKSPKKTGTLVRSLHADIQRLTADLIEGRVGTWLEYARWLEEGTGLYGPRKQAIQIVPRAKKGLFWGAYDDNGGPVVRRRTVVKGIKPIGYFAQAIAEFLPRYVEIIQEELAKAAAA